MNKKNKNNILMAIVIIIVLIIVVITIVRFVDYIKNKPVDDKKEVVSDVQEENVRIENGRKINISPKIAEDKIFGNYILSDIVLESTASGTVLTGKISTTLSEKSKEKTITINFYDSKNDLLSTMKTGIGEIKPEEKVSFRASSTSQFANAYDFEILVDN